MQEAAIARLCASCFSVQPSAIERCAMGIGNYVYRVACAGETQIVRCSTEPDAYRDTITWLTKLQQLDVLVPKIIAHGTWEGYAYLILSYFEGDDLGNVYPQLTDLDKRRIAKDVTAIQNRVSNLKLEDIPPDWTWFSFLWEMMDRAEERIVRNGYFDPEKVRRLRGQVSQLQAHFSAVRPIAYLDDISSKNLIIHNGAVSGIVDVDWMGVGDVLTYAALTNMALLNLGCDTDYPAYILEEMHCSDIQRKAFLFYTLLYCVDFMGERGMQFMDKRIAASPQIIKRLNRIYDQLWEEWEQWRG